MGFFNKIKDILFEDVDDESASEKKVKEDVRKPIAEKIEPQKREDIVNEEPKMEEPISSIKNNVQQNSNIESLNERDLFKSENTFPFPDFDEEEFDESVSRVQKTRATTNVLEYEKKKKIEKKYDFGRFERIEKTEVVEKKKFKPSPIISPVYGVLNEDYKIEDIKNKTEYNDNTKIDFNSVRKKAFGDVERLDDKVKNEPTTTYYEETVTVKLKEPEEAKASKVKTIDELLEDTSDEEIEIVADKKKVATEEAKAYAQIDSELDDITFEKTQGKTEEEKIEDSDTLENDLFDLIDSMYDNREDGEL